MRSIKIQGVPKNEISIIYNGVPGVVGAVPILSIVVDVGLLGQNFKEKERDLLLFMQQRAKRKESPQRAFNTHRAAI